MFYITVSNGLLTPEHRLGVGSAIWEFMWCLDKITRIDAKGLGLVLGGKPIQLKEIADALGTSEDTVSRNLHKLSPDYIALKRTPYGIIIGVQKAKKRFGKNAESAKLRRETANLRSDTAKMPDVIKTIQDNSNDTPAEFDLKAELTKLHESKQEHIRIIGAWIKGAGLTPENKSQVQSIIRRNVRAATSLKGYSLDDIAYAIKALSKIEYLSKFSLETVGKYIDDVVREKEKRGPRIVDWERTATGMRPIYESREDSGRPSSIAVSPG